MKSKFLIAGMMAGVMAAAMPVTAFASTLVPSLELPEKGTDEAVAEAPDLPDAGGTVVEGALPVPEEGSKPDASHTGGEGTITAPPAVQEGSGTDHAPEAPPTVQEGGGAGHAPEAPPTVQEGGGTDHAPEAPPAVQEGGGLPPSPSTGAENSGSQVVESGRGRSQVVGPGTGPGLSYPAANRDPSELPGIPALNPSSIVPGRLDYFSEPVSNPVVEVVEKYTYDMMVQDLNDMQSRYGQRLRVNVIGTSLDGRNLYEVVLGNPNAKKHVLIQAGIHAREYMTPLVAMKQIEYGLEFYDHGSYEGRFISDILQEVAVHFVPMANPDGILISQFGVDALQSEEWKQAVRQCYADDLAEGRTSSAFERYLVYWKANARGVNLNGNFPANWDLVGSPPKPSYASYKGEAPLSEPETKALADLAASRDWEATASYHSMGNIIYWDYDGNRVREESASLVELVAASTGYRPAGSSGHGGFKDWMQIKDNPAPGVTIEMGGVSCPLPLSEYTDVWERNKMVWILLAKYAMEH